MTTEHDALSPAALTSEAARVLTDEVKSDAAALWSKLLQLYEGDAHTTLGYSSWGAYYEAEFNESGSRGRQLLAAARVVREIEATEVTNGNAPLSERVARELVPTLRDDHSQVEEVWAEVVEEHGPTPTAAQVRESVQRRAADPPVSTNPVYAFVTEVRFQHDNHDQSAAEAWAQRLIERVSRNGAVCVHRSTRVI